MEIVRYHVSLTLIEPLLGTVPKSKQIYGEYIKSLGADNDDELTTVQEAEDRGWTGFHLLDGEPIVYDYVVKGYLKDAARMLNRVEGSQTSKLKAFVKTIDGVLFVEPRRIRLLLPAGAKIECSERPLRANTAQGERVTLARSDMAPAGTRLEFDVIILGGVEEALLREWLDYGRYRGLGQWRNAGWGRFTYELTPI